ncbi:Tar ligand binding domain-containing protein (plasmid) [Caballeronia sp. NK8]|uniref:methyl-accepting chemotaxis protein n=1 Tax=Caballeronia sp. NK8 TaxID=140098 RepID=UPI001BB7E438|nr:methyl-accepting chemotaxis protein [Caballeronia sp. NK8]BCQ26913.1 Tar ligand binding domain-containing protein [Caballeronia sp. NK8]
MSKLTVRARLAIVTGAVAAVLVAVGSVGLFGVQQGNAALRHVFEGRAQALQTISTIDELITQSQFAISDAVLDPSAQKTQTVVTSTQQRIANIDALLGRYLRYPLDATEAPLAKRLASDWATLRDKGFRPTASLLAANNLSEAQWIVTQQIEPTAARVKKETTELRAFQLSAAQQEYDHAQRVSRVVQWTVGACIAAGVALVGWLCLSMARALIRQLGGEPALAANVARRVSQGDLLTDVPVAPGDTQSVMHAMSLMRSQLASMVGDIKRSTDTIGIAAADITEGNHALSARTEEHAASLQQTSASMEQIASTVRTNADHANRARELAKEASVRAKDGERAVADAIARMTDLSARSAQIGQITGVIESIAFQTNLLALNAAVEAARAGSLGRGFAVVAEEVRALARRSSGAAKEIAQLTREVNAHVESSGSTVKHAGSTLTDLLASVDGVSALVEAIATASSEQSGGIDEVNDAVSQMDRLMQGNAALVNEAAAAALSLDAQARELRQTVQAFQV